MRIFTILFSLSFSVLSAHANDETKEMMAQWDLIERFMKEAPTFLKGRDSLEKLRNLDQLKADKVEREVHPDIPDGVIEYHTLEFKGLEIYGRIDNKKGFWPITVTVSSPKWKIEPGLSVGSQPDHVERVLGQPTVKSRGILEYHGVVSRVHFYTSEKSITKVVFHYYDG